MTDKNPLDIALGLQTAQLWRMFKDALADLDDRLRAACVYYLALLDRGEEVPLLCPAFRHAEAVVNGTLSPRVARRHATNRNIIRAMTGQPLDLQDRMVAGEKIKIAVKSNDGRVHSDERCIDEMSEAQLRRAFGADGVRDWQVQGELLLKGKDDPQTGAVRKPVIKVDRETREFIINRLRIDPDDLVPAYAALGLQVKPFTRGQIKPVRTS